MPPFWLEHCPPPRPRPEGTRWDVFISYRFVDRIWALALYDMLVQAGYQVFLDQYVLPAGAELLEEISENLQRSSSRVVVWSSNAIDSKWVKREVTAMVNRMDSTSQSALPFRFVAARLDGQDLPALLSDRLFVDFSSYPDGPTGAELVRLLYGLRGEGLNSEIVKRIAESETAAREEPARLRGEAASKQFDAIAARAQSDDPIYSTSATLPALAAQLLISGKREADALKVIALARARFPKSVRLRQLRGLALRRSGAVAEAMAELERLRADGNQDPETLGILAAIWTSSWQKSKDRDELEHARDLYAQAFARFPGDTYVAINTASKSALLGELDHARQIASGVLERLRELSAQRSGLPATDYWERATEPEALFLLGKFAEALPLYHSARIEHQNEVGSIEATAAQLQLLTQLDWVPEEWRARFQQEFKKFWPKPAT